MGERSFEEKVFDPATGQIFVFGSNILGYHHGGAAKFAYRELRAIWGLAEGPSPSVGKLLCYAIPTTGEGGRDEPLPLQEIQRSVARFIEFAEKRPHLSFFVTRIGCGLANYRDDDIAPMFASAPSNCELPHGWR